MKDVSVLVGESERKAEIPGRVCSFKFCRYRLGFSLGEQDMAIELRCIAVGYGSKLYIDVFQNFQS